MQQVKIQKGTRVPFTATPRNVNSDPRPLDGPAIVSSSDPSVDFAEVAADGLTGKVQGQNTVAAGSALPVVTLHGDADPGTGVRDVLVTFEVLVTDTAVDQAQSIDVTFGAAEPIPPTP